ncbi:hypothetical protein GW17_00050460 [Ensete ventricosum]|nr:hypothetical protein GW17_00050460 [Ensete ventricosum]RZS15613.1 hypothetical protein BHM03_00047468 [Ensete ventricosum]
MQRWLAMAKPHAGATDNSLATCKGWSPAGATARKGRPPAGTAGCGRQQPAHKGLPPTASHAASRGDDAGRRGGCPLAGRLSDAKGSRRLRRGNSEDGAARVKEG